MELNLYLVLRVFVLEYGSFYLLESSFLRKSIGEQNDEDSRNS